MLPPHYYDEPVHEFPVVYVQGHNFSASFGPVGPDGYPQPIWDHETGRIDHGVALYWRDHGFDLRAYLEAHWPEIGTQLAGKLRFFCGEADQ